MRMVLCCCQEKAELISKYYYYYYLMIYRSRKTELYMTLHDVFNCVKNIGRYIIAILAEPVNSWLIRLLWNNYSIQWHVVTVCDVN